MHSIFHSIFEGEDMIYLVLDPHATPNREERRGDVVALYRDDILIGVNYFSRGEGLPLGLLPRPGAPLLFTLAEAAMGFPLPALEEEPSGFRVLEVAAIEEHPLDERKRIVTLFDGDERFETTTRYANFAPGDRLVCLLDGHFRFDGTFFEKTVVRNIRQDVEICSEKDLGLGEECRAAFLVDRAPGEDFFA